VNGEVREICARLDNLPLAIELAAARVKVFSPTALLARLERRLPLLAGGARDAPERQRTLQATIEWSHDLLNRDEQRLFARLAVFPGGCTLESAEKVCAADVDTLASLVDKSLVRQRQDRFWMLETIREFGVDRLEASGEAEELGRRHAEHFLAVAEEAEPHLRGDPEDWLDRLDAEHDNLRTALDLLQRSGETQRALRLAAALWRFWWRRGHLAEGQRRLETSLAADRRPTVARARALDGAGVIVTWAGDDATARRLHEEALELNVRLGDAWGIAYSRGNLSILLAGEGELQTAVPVLEESARAFHELGDEFHALAFSRFLAWTYQKLGDSERHRALLEDVLRRGRATGNKVQAASALASLALIAADDSRVDDAFAMLDEALRIDLHLGPRVAVFEDLCCLARALAVAKRPEAAARLLSSADALRNEIGGTYQWQIDEVNEQTLAAIHAQLDDEAFSEAWELGRGLTVEEAVALALDARA
jgi:tetratricopeptide (TPR) repeat protein